MYAGFNANGEPTGGELGSLQIKPNLVVIIFLQLLLGIKVFCFFYLHENLFV